MQQWRTLILSITLVASSCNTDEVMDVKRVETLIERDLVRFTTSELPSEIINASNNVKLVFLGETHYLQQHHEYLLTIVEEVQPAGFTVLADELSQALSWMAEDYVSGELNDVPEYLRFLDNHLLEALRKRNAEAGEMVQLTYFDANQKGTFPLSLDEIAKIVGQDEWINIVDDIPVDTENYQQKLEELHQQLTTSPDVFLSKWGNKWYHRIFDMVKVEMASIAWRKSGRDVLREDIMKDNLDKLENDHQKILVNCGMYHAQKETFMGSSITRLAGYYEPTEVYAIAFSAIKGERIHNFFDENTIQFNIPKEAQRENLIRVMGEIAGNTMAFLEMTDPEYKEVFDVMYVSGSSHKVPPGKQFDAIITYPNVTLLSSMTEFSYK